jgi:DNA-binding response OmpR family regulator
MRRILVIDDDEICRRTVATVLEQSGYTVMQANDGEAGVQIALRDPPDLIVTDVVMPKLDGFGVFDALQTDPRTSSIPFIFMTGLVDREAGWRGMRLGSAEVLIKPFALTELISKVTECPLKPQNAASASSGGSPGSRKLPAPSM